jgi:NAD(P)-dependent dehydrogenase (short-subunit alcohol dehydrogenase family)
MELQDKVAIVVGASRGIGQAYARALARAGARVVAAARTLDAPVAPPADAEGKRQISGALPGTLKEVVGAIRAEGGTAIAVKCDVLVEDDVRALVDRTIAEFGRVDVLVNNAAVFPRYESLKVPLEDWDYNFQVNVRGPYLTMRHALPHMMAQRSGSIINLTSSSAAPTARESRGHIGLLVYGVTKAALDRLTTYLAEDMRLYGIAVNALQPGGVRTDAWKDAAPADWEWALANPLIKDATPEVMGPALIYLAQQTAETMTGQILNTDQFGKT